MSLKWMKWLVRKSLLEEWRLLLHIEGDVTVNDETMIDEDLKVDGVEMSMVEEEKNGIIVEDSAIVEDNVM